MGYTRYGKKVFDLEDLSAQELFEKLADDLLRSGFGEEWMDGDISSLDELRRAVLRALTRQAVIPLEELERMMELEDEGHDSRLGELVDRLIRRLVEEGYLRVAENESQGTSELPEDARFEISDRGLDFLGFKSLREILPQAARAPLGGHDTSRLATGVEASEAPRPYEFGDTMNLDASASILEAVRRAGTSLPIELEERDLRVRQAELRVASATVLMLDCSHSMILYGEDRFTPAKRVALAMSHLIRTRFPGDELSLVLFHDSAEEVPLQKLPRIRVGPYHTNTAAGLDLARRILSRTRREIRSIVMITDGKPSAATLPDGQIYKNSFGLDPFILKSTFDQVAACRRSGIVINTFMLARDRMLIGFVKQVSEMCRGKAYFTTPMTLGRYVTMDFMSRKIETV